MYFSTYIDTQFSKSSNSCRVTVNGTCLDCSTSAETRTKAFKDSEKAGAASMRRALLKGGGTMRVGGQTAHPVGAKLAISNLPQANR